MGNNKKVSSIELTIEWEEDGLKMQAEAKTFVPDVEDAYLARGYAERAEAFGTVALKLIKKVAKGVDTYTCRNASITLNIVSGTYGAGRDTLPGSRRWCNNYGAWDRRTFVPGTYGGTFPQDVDCNDTELQLDAAALVKSVESTLKEARKQVVAACWDVAMDAARKIG